MLNIDLPLLDGSVIASVYACTDLADEGPETFRLRLHYGSTFSGYAATSTITIENAPPFHGLVLDTPTVEVIEGDTTTITWQVLTPPTQTLELDVVSPLDDIAIVACSGSADYLPLSLSGRPQVTRVVNPGSTVIEVEFVTCEDLEIEETEVVEVGLGFDGGFAGTATVKIIDDDASTVLPTVNDAQVRLIEGETGELTFEITSAPSESVPVWLKPMSGDALDGPACAGSFNVNRGTDWAGHLLGSSGPRSVDLGPDVKTVSFSIEACDLGGVELAEDATVQLMGFIGFPVG